MKWLRYLWTNDDGFFGIGQGPNAGEGKQAGDTGALADFATSTGEGDIGAASGFWKSILSGDPSKIAQVLGPEISGINAQNQQNKKTQSEFGNRSGGTNASNQAADDKTRGSYNAGVSGLIGKAAGELGSLGSGLLSTGLSGHEAAFGQQQTIHDQTLAKWNDLFKSITSVAAAPFTGGASLGGLSGGSDPGMGGGFKLPSFGGGGDGGGSGGGAGLDSGF
jgi:hypothetical protein